MDRVITIRSCSSTRAWLAPRQTLRAVKRYRPVVGRFDVQPNAASPDRVEGRAPMRGSARLLLINRDANSCGAWLPGWSQGTDCERGRRRASLAAGELGVHPVQAAVKIGQRGRRGRRLALPAANQLSGTSVLGRSQRGQPVTDRAVGLICVVADVQQ